jgi:hypothetical protein
VSTHVGKEGLLLVRKNKGRRRQDRESKHSEIGRRCNRRSESVCGDARGMWGKGSGRETGVGAKHEDNVGITSADKYSGGFADDTEGGSGAIRKSACEFESQAFEGVGTKQNKPSEQNLM